MFSFAKRKKFVDLSRYLRRICDLTVPDRGADEMERCENRYNRTIPTLVSPWQDGHPVLEESTIAVTSDMADHGIGLIFNQPFRAETLVLGYWIPCEEMAEPWFFLDDVRRVQAVGGGFWAVGVALTEFANTDHSERLAELGPMARHLRPPAAAPC